MKIALALASSQTSPLAVDTIRTLTSPLPMRPWQVSHSWPGLFVSSVFFHPARFLSIDTRAVIFPPFEKEGRTFRKLHKEFPFLRGEFENGYGRIKHRWHSLLRFTTYMKNKEVIFDIEKARSTIAKGRRANWWCRSGKSIRSFKYSDRDGNAVGDSAAIERITSLVIPPAWRFVRINPSPTGKIQVVGMDSTGRVQYLYNPVFAARQKKLKFAKIERFGSALPKLRETTNRDITLDGLQREKVLAVVMRLINSLYFRVGTDHSAKHYRTFGITTLQKRHLKIGSKGKLQFDFVGKSHIEHRKVIVDEELAGIVKDLMNIKKGRKLFQYLDEVGQSRPVTPAQINSYIKSAIGSEFSSKDFRTWGATVLAAAELAIAGADGSEAEKKRRIVAAVKRVAEELGNTPSVCRQSYIHPTIFEAYAAGITIDEFRPRNERRIKRKAEGLDPEEKAVVKLLRSYGR